MRETRKQFKNIPVGQIFSRPAIGTQVIYRKVSVETMRESGKAVVIDSTSNPELVGDEPFTVNRGWVVTLHDSNPITGQQRANAAATRELMSKPRPIGTGLCTRRGCRTECNCK